MILLKDTSTDTLVKGCQVITLSDEVMTREVIRYRKGQRWEEIDDLLTQRYGVQYKKEVSVINSMSASAKRHGLRGCQVSLDKTTYTAANKLTKQGISYTKTKRLLELMDNDGLITLCVGYWDFVEGRGVSSFFIIEEEYDDMWEGVDTSGAMARQMESIIIRDSNTKQALNTRPFKGVTLLRQNVEAYNKLLAQNTITINGEPVDLSYKRVFHDSLKGSGRYYSTNAFQTIKKETRQEILINGWPTAELDYSAIHPRILYTLEGIRLDKEWSPYGEGSDERDLRKVCLLIMLFSRNRQSALHETADKHKISYTKAEAIMCRLEVHNAQISKHFYQKDLWKALQHYDSLIASEVLAICMSRNIVTLPYHDSFRVEEDYTEILQGAMFEAWKKVLGNTHNCVVRKA